MALVRGRIIVANIPDPQGRNAKMRPAIVVFPPPVASPGSLVHVIGISTQIGMAPAAVCVDLPWHRGGHPRTGLTSRCEAVCTWPVTITVAEVVREIGIVPGDRMLRIMQILTNLTPPPPPTPPPPAPPPP